VVDIKSLIINTIEKQETKMEIHKIENGVIVEINGKPVNEAPKAAKPKRSPLGLTMEQIKEVEKNHTIEPITLTEEQVTEYLNTKNNKSDEEVKLEDSANTEATAGSNEE
jgi:hypothetical protein